MHNLKTDLNDPPSDLDRSDCNLRLVCPLMERKIEFLITESGFRLLKGTQPLFKDGKQPEAK